MESLFIFAIGNPKNIIAMKTNNYLLPYRFKRIGLFLFVPFCAACLWLLVSGELDCSLLKIPVLSLFYEGFLDEGRKFFRIVENDPINEIAMLGLLVSMCMIALSRERDEDEMTAHVRMQSFVWSFWVSAGVTAFGILFLYEMAFLYFAFIAVFLVFLLFIMKFNFTMHKIRRENA